MKKLAVILTCLVLLVCGAACQQENAESFQTITPEKAYQRLDQEEGIVLIDVRTEEEYQEKHIPGSVLLPLSELEKEIEEVVQDKETVVFIYCRSGNRSAQGAKILSEMGYTEVYDLGGIIDWPYETQP